MTTAPFVQQVDDLQYSCGQGPCITAAADGMTVLSDSLGADPLWPRFGGQVAWLGVHSGVFNHAVGILMSRSGDTEAEAFAHLRMLSQSEHHKLVVVARKVVDEAVRRARGWGFSPPPCEPPSMETIHR